MSSNGSPHGEKPAAAVVPKRGARACTKCRQGKARCEPVGNGNGPCRRCTASGQACVFEAAPTKSLDEERVDRMEHNLQTLQSTVNNLVSLFSGGDRPALPSYPQQGVSLQSIASSSTSLNQHQHPMRLDASFNARSPLNPMSWDVTSTLNPLLPQPNYDYQQNSLQPPTIPAMNAIPRISNGSSMVGASPTNGYGGRESAKRPRHSPPGEHPPLPNYRAPPHPISQYGLIASAAPSDDEDDSDALPRASLTAPFEALAEAAAAAAGEGNPGHSASGTGTPAKGRPKKRRRRRMPPPPNAFPDVIDKGLVSEPVGRHLFSYFFEHCHRFYPILDPTYDTWSAMRERTPWAVDSLLATAAARIPNPSPDVAAAAEQASEEAHGIARSSLFGPTVRKEGVQAMAMLAAWSDNGYLAAGHALRMGLDLGLHRALDKLSGGAVVLGHDKGKIRREEDERDLVISARIFLSLYLMDFLLSTGSGRPHMCDEDLVSPEKLTAMLRHPFSTDSDRLLVAQIELISCRTRIEAMTKSFGATLDSRSIDYSRRASRDLQTWWKKWDAVLAEKFDEESFERKMLLCSLHSATIFLVMASLKNLNLTDTNLSVDARELAMSARQSATLYLDICLNSPVFRGALRYATNWTIIDVSFCGLLLLKLSRLFPDGVDSLSNTMNQCKELSDLLLEFPGAQRFGRTISISIERFAKAFAMDLPTPPRRDPVFPNDFLLNPAPEVGLSPFDIQTLLPISDPSWVGSELFPEWLSSDSWTFGPSDLDQGLDKLFLPLWSTQVETTGYGEVEW